MKHGMFAICECAQQPDYLRCIDADNYRLRPVKMALMSDMIASQH